MWKMDDVVLNMQANMERAVKRVTGYCNISINRHSTHVCMWCATDTWHWLIAHAVSFIYYKASTTVLYSSTLCSKTHTKVSMYFKQFLLQNFAFTWTSSFSSSSSSSLAPQPLRVVATLMTLLHRFLSRAFFQHVFASRVLRSLNADSNLLNLDLPIFLLISSWEKVICMQGTLSYTLAMCPNHFNLPILIIFTIFGCVYKLYSNSLYFILHTTE